MSMKWVVAFLVGLLLPVVVSYAVLVKAQHRGAAGKQQPSLADHRQLDNLIKRLAK